MGAPTGQARDTRIHGLIAWAIVLFVFGWTFATLLMATVGRAMHATSIHPGMIAFERTAILSGLTIVAAWAARFEVLSPGKRLANVLMVGIAMKLLWDDLRVGTPTTMFLSFACVGAAMIVATRLKKNAVEPQRGSDVPSESEPRLAARGNESGEGVVKT